jgi:hypothetical protein
MPLHDHFHPPVSQECPWESFHSTWANAIVLQLNGGLLPSQFRAFPHLHMGTHVAVDVGTFHRASQGNVAASGPALATATWAPPKPAAAAEVDFADRDTFEVTVVDSLQRRLVAALELVSPGNKDRPSERRDFAVKCASYLQQNVALIVVDVVTSRRANLHQELTRLLDLPSSFNDALQSPLYAAAYRLHLREDKRRELEIWPAQLALEEDLPTVPLWLGADLVLPLNLEESYQAALEALRWGGP